MKETKSLRRGFSLIELMMVIAIIGLLAVLLAPVEAKAQGYSATNLYLGTYWKTNTYTLTNGQTLNLSVTNQVVTVPQHRGLAMFMRAKATTSDATGTTTVTAKCDTTPDNVNWTTTHPLAMTPLTLNGQTYVMDYTNWPANGGGGGPTLDNVPKVALTQLVNTHTQSVTVTVWFSVATQ